MNIAGLLKVVLSGKVWLKNFTLTCFTLQDNLVHKFLEYFLILSFGNCIRNGLNKNYHTHQFHLINVDFIRAR